MLFSSLEFLVLFLPLTLAVALRLRGQPLLRWIALTSVGFYTFQTLAYIIDVWRGQAPAERNFVRFAGFVSFFPHLIAGPLTRHHQLIPQLGRIAQTGIDPRWRAGVLLFCIGLAKKVLIAD